MNPTDRTAVSDHSAREVEHLPDDGHPVKGGAGQEESSAQLKGPGLSLR